MKVYETNDDYFDKNGENMFAEVESPFIEKKKYICKRCKKVKMEPGTFLFAPFCCGHPMEFDHFVENKFDLASITKRLMAKGHVSKPKNVKVARKKAKVMKVKAKKVNGKKSKKRR